MKVTIKIFGWFDQNVPTQFLESEGGKQLRINAREVANTLCEIPLQV